jgi:hypothetical protein
MATTPVEIQGTLQADGSLVLDEKPSLPPGRVRVTLQPVLDYTQTPIWQFFERIRAENEARGFIPRSREEIDAAIAAARQEDEERMQEIERLHEECERSRRRQGEAGQP